MRDSVEQLLRQGFVHFSGGRFAQADGVYRKVLDRQPNNHEAVHMSAVIAHAMGQPDRASKLFARAIELAPDEANYYQNAGKFYAENDRHDSAIPYLKRAVELNPKEVRYFSNLANSLRTTGDLDAAEGAAREGLKLAPDDAGCLAQLGNVLREMGRVEEAMDALKRSVVARPVAHTHDSLMFLLYVDPTITPEKFLEHHRWWAKLYSDPIVGVAKPLTGVDRSPERKVRIGYLSPDFRQHPVMAFMDGVLRSHDPRQFEVTCYSLTIQHDEVTKRMQKYPLRFVDVRYDPLDKMVERIRKDRIDILVELAGHTAHNRMMALAARCAPVQISYLGDPGTTGMGQVDYRITDEVVDPVGVGEKWYTEELIRLPSGFSCYTPERAGHPDVSPLPALANGYVTFGALHTLAKVGEGVLDLWCRVLRAVPGSRMVMLRNTLSGSTLARYREGFVKRGVEAERLDLRNLPLGGPTHVFTYRHIDIALDCFPFSGHTTACEAMYNGVPTLTLPGERPASRFVASVMGMGGLGEFVARDGEEFVEKAVGWAGDPGKLAELRAGLRDKMLRSALCDAGAFTRELEGAYRGVWRRHCEVGK